MHELSIVRSIISLVKENGDDRPLKNIVVRVGILSCIQPESLKFCFSAIKAQETLLEHCDLTIIEQQPSATCQHCGYAFKVKKLGEPCQCGAFDYDIEGGDDLILQQLEY